MQSKDCAKLLKLAACELVLGEIPRGEVGRVALELVESGAQGWRLASLAALHASTRQDNELESFRRAIEEEGITLPSHEKAIEYVLEHICGEITHGTSDPIEALVSVYGWIVELRKLGPNPQFMAEFLGCYHQLLYVREGDATLTGAEAQELRKDIRDAAQNYLAKCQET